MDRVPLAAERGSGAGHLWRTHRPKQPYCKRNAATSGLASSASSEPVSTLPPLPTWGTPAGRKTPLRIVSCWSLAHCLTKAGLLARSDGVMPEAAAWRCRTCSTLSDETRGRVNTKAMLASGAELAKRQNHAPQARGDHAIQDVETEATRRGCFHHAWHEWHSFKRRLGSARGGGFP